MNLTPSALLFFTMFASNTNNSYAAMNDDRSLLRSSVQEKASSSDGRERKLYINKVPPPEGRSVRCVEDPKRVFRWTDKQLRHYPSGKIASSWDPEWRDVVSLECAGLDIASPMSLNYGDLPPSNRRPKVTNNDPDPSWTDHFETMGDQIEEVQGDMYDEIEEVQSDMYDEIEEVRNDMSDHTEYFYTYLSEVQDNLQHQFDEIFEDMYRNYDLIHEESGEHYEHIEKMVNHNVSDLHAKNYELEMKITAMAKMIEKLISNDDNLFSQEEKDLLEGF